MIENFAVLTHVFLQQLIYPWKLFCIMWKLPTIWYMVLAKIVCCINNMYRHTIHLCKPSVMLALSTNITSNKSRSKERGSTVCSVGPWSVDLHMGIEGKVDGREWNISQETGRRTLREWKIISDQSVWHIIVNTILITGKYLIFQLYTCKIHQMKNCLPLLTEA